MMTDAAMGITAIGITANSKQRATADKGRCGITVGSAEEIK